MKREGEIKRVASRGLNHDEKNRYIFRSIAAIDLKFEIYTIGTITDVWSKIDDQERYFTLGQLDLYLEARGSQTDSIISYFSLFLKDITLVVFIRYIISSKNH